MQTHTFPHCFDCILSPICLFNEHFLRTYVCFLFAWQVQTASGLLVSIFHRLSYVSKETHGQLNRTLGLGPRPWSGLWLLSGATDVLWYQNVLAVFEHLSHIRTLCTRKNSHSGWTACLLYHFFPYMSHRNCRILSVSSVRHRHLLLFFCSIFRPFRWHLVIMKANEINQLSH